MTSIILKYYRLLEEIILISSLCDYPYKGVVYDIGDPTENWYFIKNGEFGLYNNRLIKILMPGDVFG